MNTTDSRGVIAVVDDDEPHRLALGRLLRVEGFEPVLFDSAETFLDALATTQPFCVLLDVDLPGMSGLALQERLQGRTTAPLVIILTGSASPHARSRAEHNGCAGFFEKPVSSEMLLSFIRLLATRSRR